MTRILGGLTLVALASLVAGSFATFSARIDDGAHDRYVEALQRATELDARLDSDVAESRLGVVTHYDALVRTWDETRANATVLAQPAGLRATDRFDVDTAFAEYRDVVEAKRAGMETFKAHQAVLRNSLRALPRSADDLAAGADTEDVVALEQLLRDVLLLAVDATPSRAQRARCALAALGAGEEGNCEVAPRIVIEGPIGAAMVRHAEVVVERSLEVERVVSAMVTLPVGDRVRALRGAYLVGHQRAIDALRSRTVFLLLSVGGVLLSGSATVIARLDSSARAVRETGRRLEVAMDALRVERDRVVELANLKNRFVAMTSHEFRTPLSVIRSSADLLAAYGAGWDADRRAKHLGRIQDSAMAMTRMLDRVLVIGRADAGMLEVHPHVVKLDEVVRAVIEETRAVVGSARRLDLVNECPGVEVSLDDTLVRHVLTNLLSNAFKYSPEDSTVRLVVRRVDGAALFDVTDEGIGIPPEEISELFEPFHRCTNAQGFRGTGLGLTVVKRALDVHGGTIDVQSELGRGTQFSVRVPLLEDAA